MSLLLDTHVWLWLGMAPKRIGAATVAILENRANALYLSMASIWEMAIKDEIGKLDLPVDFQTYIRTRIPKSEASILHVALNHLFELKSLDRHHRDPFDRMLVAQARVENMTLVTADERLFKYPVRTLDART